MYGSYENSYSRLVSVMALALDVMMYFAPGKRHAPVFFFFTFQR